MEDLDLFGEVVITLDDVELWLDAVPKLPRDSPRRKDYAKGYDVTNKIKRFKLDGRFAELINEHFDSLAKLNHGRSNVGELFAVRYR